MRRSWLVDTVLALAAVAALVTLAGVYLVSTPGGARLVLDRAAALLGKDTRLSGVEGSLAGTLRVKSVEVKRPDFEVRIDDLEIERAPGSDWFGRVWFKRLHAARIEVRTAQTDAAARIPLTFRPPYPVRVDEARVGELRWGPLRAGSGAPDVVVRNIVVKGEGGEESWTIESATADTDYGAVRLKGSLATKRPFALEASASLEGAREDLRYRATGRLAGNLQRFDARFDLEERELRGSATAVVEPFEKPPVKSVAVRVVDIDTARFGAPASSRAAIEASLAPVDSGVKGPVKIANADPGPLDRGRWPIGSASGEVTVARDRDGVRVAVDGVAIALSGGGRASGNVRYADGRLQFAGNIADVDLSKIDTRLRPTRLAGTVSATTERDRQQFEVAVKDPRFAIQGKAVLAGQRLEVEEARVRHASGEVKAKGFVATAGRREFRFEGRGEHFDPSAFLAVPAGDLNFDFAASGALQPQLAGELTLSIAESRFAGKSASGRVHLAGDRRRISAADVRVMLGDGRLEAKGSFGRPGDALQFALQAPELGSFAQLIGARAAGRIDAQGRLVGTFDAPGGQVTLTGTNLLVEGVRFAEVKARADVGTEADSRVEAAIEARGVTREAREATRPVVDRAQLQVRGTRSAHRADVAASLRGEGEVKASLQGGLQPKGPLAWRGELRSLELTGRSAFALARPATLFLSADRVELGGATLRGAWGEAHLVLSRWTPTLLELRGTTPGIGVREAARALQLQTVPRGRLALAGEWDLRAGRSVDGSIAIRRVSGDLRLGDPPEPLGLEAFEARVDIRQGRARAVAEVRGRRIGNIKGEMAGTLEHARAGVQLVPTAPLEGRIEAEMPSIGWAAVWMGPEAQAEGRVRAHVALSGTAADPHWSGELVGEGIRLREPQSGFEVSEGRASLRLRDRSLVVERLHAKTPWRPPDTAVKALAGVARPEAGELSAEGAIDLRARTGAIVVKAKAVPVNQIASRFLALSGDARLEARPDGLVATGVFTADAGWFGARATALPSVSDDVVVVSAAAPRDSRRVREQVRLDVRFDLGSNVWFRGRGLDTRLAGNLRVVGQLGGGLRGTGAIRTVGGTYDAYGQKLSIDHGTLTFFGSLENPALNVMALRKGLPVEAGVEVLGTVSRPRVRLVSLPNVPDPEKISWLVLGRGPEDVSQGEAATLIAAANAILGRTSPGSEISRRFGFDEVRIGRADTTSALGTLPQSTVAGRTGTASATEAVTVGKRLHKDIYVVYEQGLAEAEGALRIAWQITDKFQVLLRAGYLPGIDAVYRWTFE